MATAWRRSRMAALAGLVAVGTASAADPGTLLAEFGRQHGVKSWPRLQACGYDRPWTGVAATVLTVRIWSAAGQPRASGETALRKGFACQVGVRHRLENWPADLPSGTYIVAATMHEPTQSPQRPWRLNVVAVARGVTAQDAEAAARQIDARLD